MCPLFSQLLNVSSELPSDQAEARRAKNKAAKQRREDRLEQKKKDILASFAKEEEAAAK